MNYLFRAIAVILMWIAFFSLFFVFSGEPDLWDKLHDLAMSSAECKK